MDADEAQALCTRCGLCCDGSLLGDVELAGAAEAGRIERLGLELDDDGDGYVLPQPCAALDGCRCTIYAQRPGSCRAFECALLQKLQRGDIGPRHALIAVERARARIREVERLLGPARGTERLPLAERCSEALAREGAQRRQRRARLSAAVARMQRSLRATFLDAPRGGLPIVR